MTSNSARYAREIRALSLKLVHQAQASHIGSALSIADVLAVLFSDCKICNVASPGHPLRDRIILSKGHACVSLYSALHLKGFFGKDLLFTYGQDFSALMNHASHKVPGVEFSTGALGHGLPIACGKALAARMRNHPWRIFVILSDGELQEGSNWEAFMFAGHHRLNNLIACIDNNNLQSLDTVDRTLSLDPLEDKLRAFGWHVETVDGHNHASISKAIATAKSKLCPSALILKTVKGKGVSFMENQVAWHYKSPSQHDLELALSEVDVL
jgi:transketolase